MLNKAGRFFAVFLLCAIPAYGAELNCFTSPAEARGFYFLRFTVEQMTIAKRCDDSYALWNPSLFSISAQVVAGNPNERKPLAQSADDLAKRLWHFCDRAFRACRAKNAFLATQHGHATRLRAVGKKTTNSTHGPQRSCFLHVVWSRRRGESRAHVSLTRPIS